MKTFKTFLLPLFLLFTSLLAACGGGGGGSSPAAATYSVAYSANGSTGGTVPSDTQAYAASSTVTVLGNSGALVKTGYAFNGWNTAADGSGTAYVAGGSITMGSANVTLYATWGVPLMGGAVQGKALTLSTVVSTLAGLKPGADGSAAAFSGPFGIVRDGGNLYVSDTGNHTIRQVVIATGEVTTLAGKAGSRGAADGTGAAARFNDPKGIATDGTHLFVVEDGNHAIRKVVIATGAVTTLAGTLGSSGSADGTGAAARFSRPLGITTDGTYLYVAEYGNSTIRKVVIATGVTTTLAGTAGNRGSTDGTGTAALFRNPQGIATDGTHLYVADTGNSSIRKVVIATGVVTTLAGTAATSGTTDGEGTAARFDGPRGLYTDGTDLYVADSGNSTIRRVVIATGMVTTLAGTAGTDGSADGTGTAASFNYPTGITSDGANLYVVDSGNAIIRKVVIATAAVTKLAGTSAQGSSDGVGSAARFGDPAGVASDGTNLYVADPGNHTIRKVVIATGAVTTLAGTAGSSGSADGTGAAARFNYPYGITTDGTNLYVTDTDNRTIRKVVIATGVVTTLAGTADSDGSADGTGTAARFSQPEGITTDGSNLYVTDGLNRTIRKVVIATGVVTTLAGTAGSSGSTDGTGAAARFFYPRGITTDGTDLYVADAFAQTIRKVVIATGAVTTLAGAAGSNGAVDGTGAAARFSRPYGITTDGTHLYLVDEGNHTIRKVVIATGMVSTLAGTAGSDGSADDTGAVARFRYPQGITTDGTSLYVTDGNYTIRKIQ